MKEVIQNINWLELLSAIWTIVLVPILTKLYSYLNHILFIQVSLLLYLDSILIIKKVWFHSNF